MQRYSYVTPHSAGFYYPIFCIIWQGEDVGKGLRGRGGTAILDIRRQAVRVIFNLP